MRKYYSILFVFLSFTTSAQESILSSFKKGLNKLDVGVHGGAFVGLTDVQRYNFYPASIEGYNALKEGGGISFAYPFNHIHSVKLSTAKGQLGGVITQNQVSDLALGNHINSDLPQDGLLLHHNFYYIDFTHSLDVFKFFTSRKKRIYTTSKKVNLKTIFGFNTMFYRSYVTSISNPLQVARDANGSVMYRGYDAGSPQTDNPNEFAKKSRVQNMSIVTGLELNSRLSKKLVMNTGMKYFISQSDDLDGWVIDAEDKIVNDKYSYLYLGITYMLRKEAVADEWTSPLDDLYQFKEDVSYKIDGLMTDVDQDGVSDQFDKELNTPLEAVVNGSGVSMDSDSDGIIDLYDKERFSNLGAVVNEYGVEYDDDQDGIPNSKDLDSNTVLGGLVDVNGRAIALDYDPTTLVYGGSAVSNGFLPSIYFDNGSSVVNSEQYKLLASVVQTLLKNSELDLVVVGHTDSRGTVDNNEVLGYERAAEVVRILTAVFGVPLDRFEIQTRGETQPLALPPAISVEVETSISGLDDQLSEINRRVDFEIAE